MGYANHANCKMHFTLKVLIAKSAIKIAKLVLVQIIFNVKNVWLQIFILELLIKLVECVSLINLMMELSALIAQIIVYLVQVERIVCSVKMDII